MSSMAGGESRRRPRDRQLADGGQQPPRADQNRISVILRSCVATQTEFALTASATGGLLNTIVPVHGGLARVRDLVDGLLGLADRPDERARVCGGDRVEFRCDGDVGVDTESAGSRIESRHVAVCICDPHALVESHGDGAPTGRVRCARAAGVEAHPNEAIGGTVRGPQRALAPCDAFRGGIAMRGRPDHRCGRPDPQAPHLHD